MKAMFIITGAFVTIPKSLEKKNGRIRTSKKHRKTIFSKSPEDSLGRLVHFATTGSLVEAHQEKFTK